MLSMLSMLEEVLVLSLIVLVLKASIVSSVLAIGLKATLADATFLVRHPRALARALIAMYVLAPVVGVALVWAFAVPPAVKIAIVALAVSPVPPILPNKAISAGGRHAYTIGLLVAMAVLAIVVVPLAVAILAKTFALPMRMAPLDVAMLMLTTVLAPLAVGIAIQAAAPAFAEAVARPLSSIAGALLIVSALPLAIFAWRDVLSLIGNGSVVLMAVFTIAALAAGHVLGGPRAEHRTVLALATASRHPGVALAIAHANFPEQRLAAAALLLYLVVNALVTLSYVMWIQRQREVDSPLSATRAGDGHRAA